MMEKDNLTPMFDKPQGFFDTEVPKEGHEFRFLEKLNTDTKTASTKKYKRNWLKPISIAASIAFICIAGISFFNNAASVEEQVAEISPEASKTELYFTSLIEEQIQLMQGENTPETKQIIEDTMLQLKKLEANYKKMEQDLLNGGNSKLILSAMITNFQTRIDLLQDVLNQIETIKKYKHENII